MIRLLIYVFPLLVDMIMGTLFFVCTVRMAESQASAFAVSMVCTAWALTYSVSAFFAGRVINTGNAAKLTVVSCLSLVVLSILFVLIPDLNMQYVFMIASGVIMAFFFTPFQIFMKAVMGHTTWGLSASIGLYTAAWSIGMALGPFVSGMLWQRLDWRVCHLVDAGVALICALGLYLLRHYAAADGKTKVVSEVKPPDTYAKQYDFAVVGWIFGGICFLAIAIVRAVYPTLAASLSISKSDQGLMFAIMFITQAAGGLSLAFPKMWMYRRTVLVLMAVPGVIGMLLFWLGHTSGAFFAGAMMFGLYSSMASCYIVFHSLVHPSKSTRNVSINEGLVGLTGIFGPMLGGFVADHAGLATPFLLAAIMIGIGLLVQWRMHSIHREVAVK